MVTKYKKKLKQATYSYFETFSQMALCSPIFPADAEGAGSSSWASVFLILE
jgi:hypothetical protein